RLMDREVHRHRRPLGRAGRWHELEGLAWRLAGGEDLDGRGGRAGLGGGNLAGEDGRRPENGRDHEHPERHPHHSSPDQVCCRKTFSADPARNHSMCSSDIVCVVGTSWVDPSEWRTTTVTGFPGARSANPTMSISSSTWIAS